ncbi:MAG TPA: hypothetical protein VHB25_14745 [Gemmatimonadaceae bacterium]|nr:hypothetical protein [Gemmatimonadaceae bacterium]
MSPVTPRRVALATYEDAPHLAMDEPMLVPALAALGIEPEPVVWSRADVDWRAYDAVVIRSCWDYHLRIEEFRAWLARLEREGVRVLNPPALVRWNADKRYLLDLSARGVAVIPTMVVSHGRAADVERVIAAEDWSRFVIKPAVSASGYETHALHAPLDEHARAIVARVTALGDTLLQPFAEEVPRQGELSFVFIDGVYSHAALKRARAGEFRVQVEHGGSVAPHDPAPSLIAQAEHVVRALDEVPLYARVDGIARGNALLLMELELIEPNLLLSLAPDAPRRLAQAIAARL